MGNFIPDDEAGRVANLCEYDILDTAPEPAYDEITQLAAQLCDVPIAFVLLVDEARYWMKSRVGCPESLAEAPRECSVCNTTILQSEPVVVSDLRKDERFRELPYVVGEFVLADNASHHGTGVNTDAKLPSREVLALPVALVLARQGLNL